MYADQICYYSTLEDPKTAKPKTWDTSIEVPFHCIFMIKVKPSQTVTSQQKSPSYNSQFSMSAKRLFSIVTGLKNIIEYCFLSILNLCVIFCIFIPFWPLLDLKMQLH